MVTFEKFVELFREIEASIPPIFMRELNGILVYREEKRSKELPDVYLLGEYVVEPHGRGRVIALYYGSFRALYPHAGEREMKRHISDTLEHEITHHLENLSGIDKLGLDDELRTLKWKRDRGLIRDTLGRQLLMALLYLGSIIGLVYLIASLIK